ncbi:MipA/OmpV family protein [Aliagarivorans taiwanensis]|uniref:MipA/OmpV family protein n=1 Tax=Aliagarivorans taiwanensis TaxID=561966 RepID=UPI00047E8E87|nr:MipA/OmpV family protein [Aliagarivorans taiwanensis]
MLNRRLIMLLLCSAFATNSARAAYLETEPGDWGVAVSFRSATIPFNITEDLVPGVNDSEYVNDFVPMFYYHGEHVYMDGTELGAYLWKGDNSSVALMGRYRFFDIPKDLQNTIRKDGLDTGLKWTWRFADDTFLKADLLTDLESRFQSNLALSRHYRGNGWQLTPYANAKLKSSRFNSYYYGLSEATDIDAKADIDWKVGLSGRYHLWQELYLVGDVGASVFGSNTRGLDTIDKSGQFESYVGFAFFGSELKKGNARLPSGYLRVAHNWGTPSNLGEMIEFDWEHNSNQLTSIAYGHKLSDTLLSLPIEVYLHSAFAFHYASSDQSSKTEYVFAFKGYYTFNTPVRVRFGAGEGLSYISSLTYIEDEEMKEKEYEGSKFMNYLDFSLDLNLGDLFRKPQWESAWFGYNIHHRSAIFESSAMFGRIKGGSNYHGFHLQWHW